MNFHTEYSFIFFSAAAATAAVISFFFYRKAKIPQLPKVILVILRTVNISLVLALIFISFLTYVSLKKDKPVNIFLADLSGSISLENRKSEIMNIFEGLKSTSNDLSENRYYIFSNGIISEIPEPILSDSLIAGSSTNPAKSIEDAIKSNGDRKISTINILSDGIINDGGSPYNIASKTGAALNYFLAGDTVQKKDLSIKNIYFNKTTFTGSTNKIYAEFFSFANDKEIKINLSEEDNPIQRKTVKTSRDKFLYPVTFEIKSTSEGIKKYKVEIENEPGEITYKNNSEEFFINYLDNKFNLLVISGNPSPDYSYFKEAVYGTENFKGDFFTQKSAGVFYEGTVPPLSGYDILILINYPNTSSDISLPDRLKSEIEKTHIPVFFISGSNSDYEKLKILSDYIPFNITGTGFTEEKSVLRYPESVNSGMSGFPEIEKGIINSGEVFLPGISYIPKPGTESILLSGKSARPVLMINKSDDKKSAALMCYNFFKWRLNGLQTDRRNPAGIILKNVITGIGDKEKSKRIIINTAKQVYFPHETVDISGSVNPVNPDGSESVKLKIFNSNFSKEIIVAKSGTNYFNAELKEIPEGEYNIQGTLTENGIETGSGIKKILVKESNFEYKETKSDNTVLGNISHSTGGMRFTPGNIDELKEKIYEKNKNDITLSSANKKLYLNSLLPFLIILILLLSAEWFLRKRLNLP